MSLSSLPCLKCFVSRVTAAYMPVCFKVHAPRIRYFWYTSSLHDSFYFYPSYNISLSHFSWLSRELFGMSIVFSHLYFNYTTWLFWGLHTKPMCMMIKYKWSIKMLLQQAWKNEEIISIIFLNDIYKRQNKMSTRYILVVILFY